MSTIIAILVLTGLIGLVLKMLRGTGRSIYKGVTGNDPKANAARRHQERRNSPHQQELARLTAERQARRAARK